MSARSIATVSLSGSLDEKLRATLPPGSMPSRFSRTICCRSTAVPAMSGSSAAISA